MKLKVNKLVKSYHLRPVLDLPDATFGNYPLEGLIGPNGAGKSTLMGLLTRRIPATTGFIEFEADGKVHDLNTKQAYEVARLGLVKTNQRIQNFESLSIRQSLLLAGASAEHESLSAVFGEPEISDACNSTIDDYLQRFKFTNPDGFANSAGEKKLLDILRCLILKPRMLLMDEPTAGLPEDVTLQVMEEITKQVEENNIRVLIVEHDLDLIWRYCEYVHFLSDGEMLCDGTPDQVRTNDYVAEKYLGV
ncbi:ATP-binding cassette domain-containing protein [Granulosicoccus sp.]|nr:ATP-binding cassette domain-containing protein [Granulosicoccus sp.]